MVMQWSISKRATQFQFQFQFQAFSRLMKTICHVYGPKGVARDSSRAHLAVATSRHGIRSGQSAQRLGNRRRVGSSCGRRVFKQRQQMGGFEGGRNSPAFPTEEDRRKAARAIALAGRPVFRQARSQSGPMEWWRKAMLPIRRLWFVVTRRIGMRRHGLVQLRQEVKASKYKDVHVMWEILRKSESEVNDGSPGRRRRRRQRKRPFWRAVMGASRMPYPSRCY